LGVYGTKSKSSDPFKLKYIPSIVNPFVVKVCDTFLNCSLLVFVVDTVPTCVLGTGIVPPNAVNTLSGSLIEILKVPVNATNVRVSVTVVVPSLIVIV
jgi:hypothetical protein